MGLEAVAVYSDADASALHVRAADFAVRVGPAPASENYLRTEAVLAAAQATRCDAIHPGYGFLSERALFARACEEAGIVSVDPTADTLSDKLAARRVVSSAAVPVVPGTL
jgi:acetyl/propionyl-CoA carboxylase alpha subunit